MSPPSGHQNSRCSDHSEERPHLGSLCTAFGWGQAGWEGQLSAEGPVQWVQLSSDPTLAFTESGDGP